MANQIRSLIPAIIISATLLPTPLLAADADADEKPVDMASYLCKDMMRLSGTDRDIAMGILHGYVLGKKGATSFVSSELNAQSNEFFEVCLENPQAKAMATFEEITK